mmetsp:Transcript_23557/g.33047  ORF Transcript_23557/g.33047 Transcript_23557/m.33047 type:complete len:131 (+) Transcript_23557:153-545(+)
MTRNAIFVLLFCSACSVSAFVSPVSPRLLVENTGNTNVPLAESHQKMSTRAAPRWSESSIALWGSKKDKGKDEQQKNKFMDTLKEKPGTLIILPFVAIFGIDLILNIAVVTKRSLEFFLLGQTPNADPWY